MSLLLSVSNSTLALGQETPSLLAMELTSIIEALLIASDSPLGADRMAQLVRAELAQSPSPQHFSPEEVDKLRATSTKAVTECLNRLQTDLAGKSSGITLLEKSNGWQFTTIPSLEGFVNRLKPDSKPKKLPTSLLETLAIIAYQQPVSKFTIEDIRGVSCEATLLKLIDLQLIQVNGHADLPGNPKLYETTPHFFDTLGIASLEQLPNLEPSTSETE